MEIFEDYSRIAQQGGFVFESMENNKTFITPTDRMLNSKYCLLSKNGIVYFAYDSYAAKVGMSSTFSGVYTTIPSSFSNFEAEISKRFWFDFLSVKKKAKTNNSFIDKNLVVTTNNVDQLLRIIDVRIADSYLKLWNKYPPLKIIISANYLPFIASFKDKLVIGVESNEWILPDKFEAAFKDLQEFVSEMIQRISKN